MTDARAITLRQEVIGTPLPSAHSIRLAVEVLMSNPLPVTITPQTGHLRFTGNPPTYAHTQTLNAEVVSAGNPQAQTRNLTVEVMSSNTAFAKSVRFRENIALLYGAKQDNLGIPKTLVGGNAVAGLNLTVEDNITTATQEFGENYLGRSATVSIENLTRKVTFETLFPTVNTSEILSEASLALTDWFEACGATAILNNTELEFSNETVNDCRLTVEVQQIPENADDAGQNSYKVFDSLGIVGLDLSAGKLGKLFFSFSGNPELPIYTTRLTPNFGQQKLNVLGPIKRPNVLTAVLTDLDTESQSEFCFYRLQTDSLFGFDLVQSQLSTEELFNRIPKPTPLSLVVLLGAENSVLAVTPEYCIGRRYSMKLQFGLRDYPITLEFTELQMSDYKRIAADSLVGLAIGFLNTGFTRLTFTGPASD